MSRESRRNALFIACFAFAVRCSEALAEGAGLNAALEGMTWAGKNGNWHQGLSFRAWPSAGPDRGARIRMSPGVWRATIQ